MPEQTSHGRGLWTRTLIVLAELLVPGGVLVVGLLLSEPRDKWLIAALAVAIAVTASTVVALQLSRHYTQRVESIIRDLEAAVSKHLSDVVQATLIRAEGRDGLTQEKLSQYESRIDVETIWIAGKNFDSEVASEAPFLNVVKGNIHERDIKYVYIAPNLAPLKHKLDRLKDELDLPDNDPRLTTVLLSEDEWQRMPYTAGNFTIYDPVRKGRQPEGYCWDPGGDGKSFIKLRHKVVDWVGDIQEVCKELDPKHQPGPPD